MDNLTHSLVGAALAEAGPRDRHALATPTLILAANVPDVDVVSYLIADEFAALAWRRGITHGVPALILWPFVVAAACWPGTDWSAGDGTRRGAGPLRPAAGAFRPRRRHASGPGLAEHVRDALVAAVRRDWSYGDSVFIIDPWLWLVLGGVVFLARSRTPAGVAAWAAVAALASLLVLGTGLVPVTAKVVWAAGIVGLGVARWLRSPGRRPPERRRVARAGLVVAAAYVVAMLTAALVAERQAATEARAAGLTPVDVMTGPTAGQPGWTEMSSSRPPTTYRHGHLALGSPPDDVELDHTGACRGGAGRTRCSTRAFA
jgi:inner membrane protein